VFGACGSGLLSTGGDNHAVLAPLCQDGGVREVTRTQEICRCLLSTSLTAVDDCLCSV
jgi:hypothetical protein